MPDWSVDAKPFIKAVKDMIRESGLDIEIDPHRVSPSAAAAAELHYEIRLEDREDATLLKDLIVAGGGGGRCPGGWGGGKEGYVEADAAAPGPPSPPEKKGRVGGEKEDDEKEKKKDEEGRESEEDRQRGRDRAEFLAQKAQLGKKFLEAVFKTAWHCLQPHQALPFPPSTKAIKWAHWAIIFEAYTAMKGVRAGAPPKTIQKAFEYLHSDQEVLLATIPHDGTMQDLKFLYAIAWTLFLPFTETFLPLIPRPPFHRYGSLNLFDQIVKEFTGNTPPDKTKVEEKTSDSTRSTAMGQAGDRLIKAGAGGIGGLMGT